MSEFIPKTVADQYKAILDIIGDEIIDEAVIDSIVTSKVDSSVGVKVQHLTLNIQSNTNQINLLRKNVTDSLSDMQSQINTLIDKVARLENV